MTRFLRRLPAVLSALVLGAHFYRASAPVLTAACLVAVLPVFVRTRWAEVATRAFLAVGCAVWIVTAVRLARLRLAAGEPWIRLVAILGGVAVFTAISAVVLPATRSAPRNGRNGT